jgi:arginine utilization protein RocB
MQEVDRKRPNVIGILKGESHHSILIESHMDLVTATKIMSSSILRLCT